MEVLFRITNRALSLCSIWTFAILILCVLWQVFSRFALSEPSTFTDEVARFMFIWSALLGSAYTLGQKRHLAIDLLTGALIGKAKLASDMFIIAAVAVFSGYILLYGGYSLVARTLMTGQVSPALQIPMGYIYLVIPISGAIMLFYCAYFVHDRLFGSKLGPNDSLVDPTAE
ncbi:TRAP transporter small permease [Rhodobacteraceae bacterium RKSG542]|uniref:TRAP transporter small permease n=1 Tax=Pseudovibrio flavus TaxID=2529854 RepID=UPI0012BBE074|nr:TRAP transporter small permease [Pseudovibrio flavus]MTI17962.1 TRAP transporter small permease [Pseudovibrio flavus]